MAIFIGSSQRKWRLSPIITTADEIICNEEKLKILAKKDLPLQYFGFRIILLICSNLSFTQGLNVFQGASVR
jgi:hypothetical protein